MITVYLAFAKTSFSVLLQTETRDLQRKFCALPTLPGIPADLAGKSIPAILASPAKE